MTYVELAQAIAAILPNATFGEDNDGQIVVYTNLRQTESDDNAPLTEFED